MTVPKILVCRRMPTEVLKRAEAAGKVELITQPESDGERAPSRSWVLSNLPGCAGAVICLSEKVDASFLDAAGPSLKVISTMSVGYDHIDLPLVKSRGICVGNTPRVLDDAVAEVCLLLALMVTRQVPVATRTVREGEWPNFPWTPTCFMGPSIAGKTVGLLGFGNISQSLCKLLVPFKPKRILYTTSRERKFDREDKYFASLMRDGFPVDRIGVENEPEPIELAKKADLVFVLVDLNASTKHIVGKKFLEAMKPSAYIINASRGGTVDTAALVEALRNNQIAGAGLDVVEGEPGIHADHPLLSADVRDKVALLPHIGSGTTETRQAMADMTMNNLLGALGLREEQGKEAEMDAEL
ncbi:D-isomer specific 2-hydroxyacid dehydrogenase, NAD-binding [Kalmanozyma brasiliensis GHG001]|uniref:Glyoxylate/hydroxypyruvate reductase n=1 Tax=Kalmanozyma brasiliensis (strain GHG001) TaxID=1365824 RepID=V5ERZ8_KALBG|nr:D-isomer specific 2-hydroxyacid dehydrogenase, NAD-binding [Kalmanozyma brasiliensis GHG001]EST04639.1 D-isomer specific 2-hydroxyacid dehydrogenase, NAD-binding [Kalmanozyma brasiliensis GHG001]